ncbi:MAG: glycosyltransferase [bacterium]|nr:glycosyltransferase [bacterium]
MKRYLGDKVHHVAAQTEWDHFVIVPSAEDKVETIGRSRFYHVKSLPLVGSLSYRMLLNRQKILSILGQEKPDLIEVGDPYRSAWIGLEAATRFQIPIIAFYHSDFPRALGRTIQRFCGRAIESNLSRLVNRYIVGLYNRMTATVVAGQRMEQVLTGCGIHNVVRIPLGTDPSQFKPNPLGAASIRNQLGLSSQDTLLIFVGRLAREKNIRSLLGMMDCLAQTPSYRYHLLLVGDGELRHLVEPAAAQRHDITWYRYTESTDHLTACYTAADLFVHAGQYETFGITSLEAQACGTRVLAIRSGGLDDTVEGESPSILAASPNPEELAACVRLAQNADQPNAAALRRERILARFTTERLFVNLFTLYQSIIEENSIEPFRRIQTESVQSNLDRETLLTR